MAQALRFVCSHCRRAIEVWSDGNPYYIDESGTKQYAYHPDHERLALCVGNDTPHLCLACGAEFQVDSRAPSTECPECGANELTEMYDIGGRRCPYCRAGEFTVDPDFICIS